MTRHSSYRQTEEALKAAYAIPPSLGGSHHLRRLLDAEVDEIVRLPSGRPLLGVPNIPSARTRAASAYGAPRSASRLLIRRRHSPNCQCCTNEVACFPSLYFGSAARLKWRPELSARCVQALLRAWSLTKLASSPTTVMPTGLSSLFTKRSHIRKDEELDVTRKRSRSALGSTRKSGPLRQLATAAGRPRNWPVMHTAVPYEVFQEPVGRLFAVPLQSPEHIGACRRWWTAGPAGLPLT